MSPKGVQADVEEMSERTTAREQAAPPLEAAEAAAELADEPFEELTIVEVEVSGEEIAVRAYEIHLSGSGAGHLEDWLRAEQELLAERAGGAADGAGEADAA